MCDRKLGLRLVRTEAAWAGVTDTMAFRWAPTRASNAWSLGLPAPPIRPRPLWLQGPKPTRTSRTLQQDGPELLPGAREGEGLSQAGSGAWAGKQDGGSQGRGVGLAGVQAVPTTPAALRPGRVHFASRRREGASVPL